MNLQLDWIRNHSTHCEPIKINRHLPLTTAIHPLIHDTHAVVAPFSTCQQIYKRGIAEKVRFLHGSFTGWLSITGVQ